MGLVIDTSALIAWERSVAATARSLGHGVLVGPQDEAHFRAVPGLEVSVLGG
jgi:hypothetical protein